MKGDYERKKGKRGRGKGMDCVEGKDRQYWKSLREESEEGGNDRICEEDYGRNKGIREREAGGRSEMVDRGKLVRSGKV